ncbi:hypothetical protein TNCT_356161 [Trichonephila clavata]|uniref:Uncharacterized protein n=1 Tax=Trichonephila clavata TaxID=2740835 RepID=A0A8X6KVY8_TRICU|nr:hypothetical protein TNCT_356161 [Trichonephila clavata]
MARRNMLNLTFSEAQEYTRQLSENESKNDNDEEIVFSHDECMPPEKEILSRMKIPYLIFLYNVVAEKPLLGRKTMCTQRKRLSDSNPDEMNS